MSYNHGLANNLAVTVQDGMGVLVCACVGGRTGGDRGGGRRKEEGLGSDLNFL